MENIIEVKNLKKSYGNIEAVKDISFYVEKGKLFAFLGPNGAGKSTTIDMICTFLSQDQGSVVIDGHELGKEDNAIRNIIGVVFQDGVLDKMLTVKENLIFRGSFYGLKGKELDEAIDRAAKASNVSDLLNRYYGKLSGGQRRRCDIARALLNTPKILFLDEPTTGLDPQTRKSVWDTVLEIQKKTNMTIFLTTHYMEEAAAADYIIIMDRGEIVTKGTPDQLRERYTSDRIYLKCNDTNKVEQILKKLKLKYNINGSRIKVNIDNTLDSLQVAEMCKEYISGFEVTSGSMDDVFLEVTGKEIRE